MREDGRIGLYQPLLAGDRDAAEKVEKGIGLAGDAEEILVEVRQRGDVAPLGYQRLEDLHRPVDRARDAVQPAALVGSDALRLVRESCAEFGDRVVDAGALIERLVPFHGADLFQESPALRL